MPRVEESFEASGSQGSSGDRKTHGRFSILQWAIIVALIILGVVVLVAFVLVIVLFVHSNKSTTTAPATTTTSTTSVTTSTQSTTPAPTHYIGSFVDMALPWSLIQQHGNKANTPAQRAAYAKNITSLLSTRYAGVVVTVTVLSPSAPSPTLQFTQVNFTIIIPQPAPLAGNLQAWMYQSSQLAGYNWQNIHVDQVTSTSTSTTSTTATTTPPISHDKGWEDAAKMILAAINTSVDPCQNFYQYACGTWIKNNPIPPTQASTISFQVAQSKVTNQLIGALTSINPGDTSQPRFLRQTALAYQICQSSVFNAANNFGPLIALQKLIGGWPMISPHWNPNGPLKFDLGQYVGYLEGHQGVITLMVATVGPDWKNSNLNTLFVDQGTLYLGSPKYYVESNPYMQNQVRLQLYQNFIFNVARGFANALNVSVTNSSLMQQAQSIVHFETQLASLFTPVGLRRNFTQMYNKMTLQQIRQTWPTLNWELYFASLFPPGSPAVTPNTPIIVLQPNYLNQLVRLLIQTDSRTLANYLIWRLTASQLYFLGSSMQEHLLEFKKFHENVQALPPTNATCVNMLMQAVGYSLGNLYVTQFFNDSASGQANSMILNVKSSFKGFISNLYWMDSQTRAAATAKVAEVQPRVAYPRYIQNTTWLKVYYQSLKLQPTDGIFNITEKLILFVFGKMFSSLSKPPNPGLFGMSPATVNAYYSAAFNTITFPAAILQPPFYREDFPKAVNYGAMGAIMGHELTHGFDDEGSQFWLNGTLLHWMSSHSQIGFNNMAQCIVNQYGQYCYPGLGICLDGKNTQGENIADNGGIRAAYSSYMTYIQQHGSEPRLPGLQNYTMKQIFFLSFARIWCSSTRPDALSSQVLANPHSPPMYRALNSLKNFDAFGKAFSCKIGDPMYPHRPDTCYVWQSPPVSTSPGFKQAAQMFKANMDFTVDPCKDFYQYACGNYIKNNPPNNQFGQSYKYIELQLQINTILNNTLMNLNLSNTSLPQSIRTTKTYFDKCRTMDSITGPQQLLTVINGFGGMPLFRPGWTNPGTSQLGQLLGVLMSKFGVSTFFDTIVLADVKNVSRQLLYLEPAPLNLGAKELYVNTSAPLKQVYNMYIATMTDTLVALAKTVNSSYTEQNLLSEITRIWQYEQLIAKAYVPATVRYRNMSKLYNPATVAQLKRSYPVIPWQSFLQNMLPKSQYQLINQSYPMVITSTKYTKALNLLLFPFTSSRMRTVYNYIFWRLIWNRMAFLPPQMKSKFLELERMKHGVEGTAPNQAILCVQDMIGKMPFTMGRLFITSWPYATGPVTSMIQSVLQAYKTSFTKLDWLDSSTLAGAEAKIANMLINVGYPKWITNNTALDNYYSGLSITTDDTAFTSYNKIHAYFYITAFNQLLNPTVRSQFFYRSPAYVNAWYVPMYNSITFPAAELFGAYYNPSYPKAFNYGSVGYVMGHEIGHSFDDVGVQFSANGTLSQWMTPWSQTNFNNMAQCIINQYSNFCYRGLGICVNGATGQGENIADNGGIRQAYYAYWNNIRSANVQEARLPGLEGMNMDQIFFMSFANYFCGAQTQRNLLLTLLLDPHSPPRNRVIGTAQNFDKFGKAFNCPANSLMRPENKCYIWANSVEATQGFQDAAAQLKYSFDSTLNPCQDFYKFACNNWIKRNQVPPDRAFITPIIDMTLQAHAQVVQALKNVNSASLQVFQKLKTFLNICIGFDPNNYIGNKQLLQILDAFGGFPPIKKTWSPSGFDAFKVMASLKAQFGLSVLLNPYATVDFRTPSQNALILNQAPLGTDQMVLLNSSFSKLLNAYRQKIVRVIQILGKNVGLTISNQTATQEANTIIAFETELAKILANQASFVNRNYSVLYNKFQYSSLVVQYPNFNWNDYFTNLLPPGPLQQILSGKKNIILSFPMYMNNLNGIMPYVNQRTLSSFLLWRLIQSNMHFMSAEIRQVLLEYRQKTEYVEQLTPTETVCGNYLMNYASYATSRLYIGNNYSTAIRAKMVEMITMVKKAYQQLLDDVPWMDSVSRARAQKKAKNVVANIAYPDFITNDAKLNSYYSTLSIYPSTHMDLMQALQALHSFYWTKNFMTLQNPSDRHDFGGQTSAMANAWYQPSRNSITFPAGILQPPFFRADFPSAVNFGGIGFVIGHEIGHGFDANGVHWYLNGTLQDWLDQNSKIGFQNSVNCLINQYNNFCEGKYCINGTTSQFQNLADNIGAKAAALAYYNWTQIYGEEAMLPGIPYTPQQVFYLNLGRIWCANIRPQYRQDMIHFGSLLPDYRVNGPLMNLKNFGKAFNCPQGTKMNADLMQPPGRCDIWGNPIGQSPGWVDTAKRIAAAMDTTQDPCSNFYQFACGSWLKKNPGPKYISTSQPAGLSTLQGTGQALDAVNGSSIAAFQKAKTFFAACLTSTLSNYPVNNGQLVKSLNAWGGWPPITPSWTNTSKYNTFRLAGHLQAVHGVPTIFSPVVTTDVKMIQRNVLYLDQATLVLGSRQYYLQQDKFAAVIAAYRNLIINVTTTLAQDVGDPLSPQTVARDADYIIRFEADLANISVPDTQLRNFTQMYNRYTVSSAVSQWPNIDWLNYLGTLLPASALSYVRSNGLVVLEPSYMTQLNLILSHESARIESTYLLWRLIYSKLQFFDYRYRSFLDEFLKVKDPKNPLPPERSTCIQGVIQLMPWAAGRLYLKNSVYQTSQYQMVNMMTNMITDQFSSMLNTLPWLDKGSQQNANIKIQGLIRNIGYPSWIMNDIRLNQYYSSLSIPQGTNFWDASSLLIQFVMNKQYGMLGMPSNRYSFGSSPATVDAWYNGMKNSLTIPAAILQPPFFSPAYPKAVNYGSIGMIIGHELSHAFDDEGSQFFSNGTLYTWLDSTSQAGFNHMAQCVVDQYGKYCYPNITPSCINGVNTQGENIADNGGIRAAYYAYKKYAKDMGPESLLPRLQHFSMDQIFFLSFGYTWCRRYPSYYLAQQMLIDPHSPAKYRVIGSLQNFQEFRKAFQCPAKSYMAPTKTCNVWSYPVSKSRGWNDIGKMIKSNLDTTAKPCQNFYQYACGNWTKIHPIPSHQNGISAASIAADQIIAATNRGLNKIVYPNSYWPRSIVLAKIGYDSCMAATNGTILNNTREIVNALSSLGGWPPVVPNWQNTNGYDLFKIIATLSNKYGISTLLTPFVDADWRTPLFHALYVHEAQLTLGSRLYYLNQTVFAGDIVAYKKMIVQTVQLLSTFMNVPYSQENAQRDAELIFQLEVDLAQHVVPPMSERNFSQMYNPTNGPTAQSAYKYIDWHTYLQTLLPADLFPRIYYNKFIITQPGYMEALNNAIPNFGHRRLASYLLWRLLLPNLPYMGQQFREIYLDFKKVHDVVDDLPPATSACTRNIINGMPYAAGRLYVSNGYNMATTPLASSMINGVLSAFNTRLGMLPWLDSTSLTGAHAKVTNIVKNVGYPSWIMENQKLDEWYNGLNFNKSVSWFDIQATMTTFRNLKQWEKLGTFRDRTNFGGTPAVLNAWYSPERNSITFPAGILQAPFFRVDYPMAVNFGGIGTVIGHELTHGFDDMGVQFNGTGYLQTWIDSQSYLGFKNMSSCVIKEYNKVCFPNVTKPFNCINGINTQGENIADNGGIKASYNAYMNWIAQNGREPQIEVLEKFSMEQVFFLNFGNTWCSNVRPEYIQKLLLLDPHSPPYARVTESVKNFDAFGKAFNCKLGDPMYPIPGNKCNVW